MENRCEPTHPQEIFNFQKTSRRVVFFLSCFGINFLALEVMSLQSQLGIDDHFFSRFSTGSGDVKRCEKNVVPGMDVGVAFVWHVFEVCPL